MNKKVFFEWIRDHLVSGIILFLIIWFITNTVLVPRTNIEIKCEGITNLSEEMIDRFNSVGIDINKYLSLSFINHAKFAGENFNIILTNVNYDYLNKFHGLPYSGDFLCNIIPNKYNFAYFKCDYIPPESSIELRLLPFFDSFEIIYWSKTTPKKNITISCS